MIFILIILKNLYYQNKLRINFKSVILYKCNLKLGHYRFYEFIISYCSLYFCINFKHRRKAIGNKYNLCTSNATTFLVFLLLN